MNRLVLVALLSSLAVPPLGAAEEFSQTATPSGPASVVLVRHAEKAIEPASDPALSDAGRERAELLERMLAGSGVDALWASDRRRTQETLAPLSASQGLEVAVVAAEDVPGLVERLLAARTRLAVVAGHSDTVPAILAGLGVADPPVIADHEYDRLFLVTLSRDAEPPSMVELRFGAAPILPDPLPADPE